MEPSVPFVAAVVLVVEDEPVQRMMAVDLVEQAGFEPVEAVSSDDAMRILETRPDIRVVFTDIDLPGGVDGMKLAAAIRDRWPPIELIIVSGKYRPIPDDLPDRAVFFAKPYRREVVRDAVKRFVSSN